MSIWWALQLRREAACVPLARRVLLQAMETEGVDREVAHELSVALTEACANAVEHGVGERSEVFCVTAWLDGDRCRIEVTDTGPGFSRSARRASRGPASRTDTGEGPGAGLEAETGRGLFLIEALTDSLHVGNRPGRGAVISFTRTLTWQDGDGRLAPQGHGAPLLQAG